MSPNSFSSPSESNTPDILAILRSVPYVNMNTGYMVHGSLVKKFKTKYPVDVRAKNQSADIRAVVAIESSAQEKDAVFVVQEVVNGKPETVKYILYEGIIFSPSPVQTFAQLIQQRANEASDKLKAEMQKNKTPSIRLSDSDLDDEDWDDFDDEDFDDLDDLDWDDDDDDCDCDDEDDLQDEIDSQILSIDTTWLEYLVKDDNSPQVLQVIVDFKEIDGTKLCEVLNKMVYIVNAKPYSDQGFVQVILSPLWLQDEGSKAKLKESVEKFMRYLFDYQYDRIVTENSK